LAGVAAHPLTPTMAAPAAQMALMITGFLMITS
jgi:hypothetical protein